MATAVAGRRAMRLSLLAESLLLFVFRHTRLYLPQERETGSEGPIVTCPCGSPKCLRPEESATYISDFPDSLLQLRTMFQLILLCFGSLKIGQSGERPASSVRLFGLACHES